MVLYDSNTHVTLPCLPVLPIHTLLIHYTGVGNNERVLSHADDKLIQIHIIFSKSLPIPKTLHSNHDDPKTYLTLMLLVPIPYDVKNLKDD